MHQLISNKQTKTIALRCIKAFIIQIGCLMLISLIGILLLRIAFNRDIRFGYGCIYIVEHGSDEPLGPVSYDGKFVLMEMKDANNEWIQYTVWDNDFNDPVYTTIDQSYYSRFTRRAYWIDNSYDFCVTDSDNGGMTYIYTGDGILDHTWITEIEWSRLYDK